MGVSGQRALFKTVKGSDLTRDDANNQPFISDLDKNDSFTWAEYDAANNFHSTLPKSLAARNLAGQPSRSGQKANDQG